MDKVYFAARWDKGTADYINCPFTKEEYDAFIDALASAEAVPTKPVGTHSQWLVPGAPSQTVSYRLRWDGYDLHPRQARTTSKAASPLKRPPAAAATPSASAP